MDRVDRVDGAGFVRENRGLWTWAAGYGKVYWHEPKYTLNAGSPFPIMTAPRAYTLIDPGTARIGNAWLERSWSNFMGNTIGLAQKTGSSVEWCRGKSPEFRIETGQASLGIMDLGYTQWSEEYSPESVTLLMEQEGPDWVLTVHTTAFHACGGLWRGCALTNSSPEVQKADHLLSDILPLPRNAVCMEQDIHHVILHCGNQGLLIGTEEHSRVDVGCSEELSCRIAAQGPWLLEPGATLVLPGSYIVPFTGAQDQAWAAQEQFMKAVRALRVWQQEQRMAEHAALHEKESEHIDGSNN